MAEHCSIYRVLFQNPTKLGPILTYSHLYSILAASQSLHGWSSINFHHHDCRPLVQFRVFIYFDPSTFYTIFLIRSVPPRHKMKRSNLATNTLTSAILSKFGPFVGIRTIKWSTTFQPWTFCHNLSHQSNYILTRKSKLFLHASFQKIKHFKSMS